MFQSVIRKPVLAFVPGLICLVLLLSSCSSSKPSSSRASLAIPAEQRYREATEMIAKRKYDKAITRLEPLMFSTRATDLEDDVLHSLAEAYFLSKQYLLSADIYRRLLQQTPDSPFAKDAQYQLGRAYEKLSPMHELDQEYTVKAIAEFQTYLDQYPGQESEQAVNDVETYRELLKVNPNNFSYKTKYAAAMAELSRQSPSSYCAAAIPVLREKLAHNRVCKPAKIAMLGAGSISGVDLIRFQPNTLIRAQLREELAVSENDCVFLFVGRLCRDKGLFDLLAAFSKIRVERQNAVLWIVGPDEEGIIGQVKARSAELYGVVKWIGPTFSPEHYMSAADVLLLPSYREGFGSVIIEAAACQLPTIAYRIDGVVDAVVDGKTGLLVSLGNVEGLEMQMELLLNNPALRDSLGTSARDRARCDFSSETVTRAWLDFYASILK